jgi:uncharacterized protein YecA (UPF0149 family)
VAISVCGDWEDVQISLGLLEKRITPDWIRRNAIREELGLKPERPSPATPNPGRNDPCPCGSGKKYKKCCMDKPA